MGVYNMGNGSVEPLRGYASDTNLVWPPTIGSFLILVLKKDKPYFSRMYFAIKCKGQKVFFFFLK